MSSSSSNARILAVDDEEDVTLFLKIGLEEFGFKVVTFNDPLQALANFKAGLYDLVLIDIKMPKMDGFELYEQIEKIDDSLKVCFMTAFEVYYEALKELFPDTYPSICFIKKPAEIQEIVRRINSQMSRSKSK